MVESLARKTCLITGGEDGGLPEMAAVDDGLCENM